MNIIHTIHVFAAGENNTPGTGADQGANTLVGTGGIADVITKVGGFIGVAIVLLGLLRAITHFTKGEVGKGIKLIGGAILGGIIFFNLNLVLDVISAGGSVIGSLISSLAGLVTGNGG